jgi:putative ABC transport system permease protein
MITMLLHNLLLTYRNYKRFKGSFIINSIGLSSGLACAIMIYLWVNEEWQVDKFHVKNSRLFQVMERREFTEGIEVSDESAGLLAEALVEEIPGIEYAATVAPPHWFAKSTLSFADKNIRARGQYVGKDFFRIFSYELIEGDEKQVLADPHAIVLSESLARSLFDTTANLIGRQVGFQHERQYLVSGIFRDVPASSSMQFDFVLPFDDYKNQASWVLDWANSGPNTYFTVQEGTDIDQLNQTIAGLIQRKSNGSHRTLFLRPYAEKYLYGTYENGVQSGGRIMYLRLFSLIALFILIIACINFMNLSTAKASRRVKEVGIKKVVGAGRRTLIVQYLSESLLMTVLSLGIALLIVSLLLPHFSAITGRELTLEPDIRLIVSLLLITLFTGLVSGSYPALYLSGFNPTTVLKGRLPNAGSELWVRKGLVVFQFTLSVVMIVAVIVVYQQIRYVQTTPLGYDRSNVVLFDSEAKVKQNPDAFLAEIRNIPGVRQASSTRHDLVGHSYALPDVYWEGKDPAEVIFFENVRVNYGMIETLGFEVIQGRAFSRDFGTDSLAIILNEAAVQVMGLRNPVGESVRVWRRQRHVIGVVRNFHFESLHQPVKPLLFTLIPHQPEKIVVRVEAGREEETLRRLKQFYEAYNPGFDFDYTFMDQDYQAQYAAEHRVALLSRYFAGLAIIISCLGLFGLAAFTAERRRKEIGIRKVLGSSEWRIIYLLSSDFTRLVLLAIGIALPVSYLLARWWLAQFAYHIELHPWYFGSAALAAITITWLTVGVQAIKAAKVNPVQCLRDE